MTPSFASFGFMGGSVVSAFVFATNGIQPTQRSTRPPRSVRGLSKPRVKQPAGSSGDYITSKTRFWMFVRRREPLPRPPHSVSRRGIKVQLTALREFQYALWQPNPVSETGGSSAESTLTQLAFHHLTSPSAAAWTADLTRASKHPSATPPSIHFSFIVVVVRRLNCVACAYHQSKRVSPHY
jgi:hypothetical protein